MPVPDMRAHMEGLIGQDLRTPVHRASNRILGFEGSRVIVATDDNPDGAKVSISLVQSTVNSIYDGNEVIFNPHNRSAFLGAVLETMDEIEVLTDPRRARLTDDAASRLFPDREFDELFPQGSAEGRIVFRQHRQRERDPALVRLKKQEVLQETGRLACEVCDLEFSERYGELGEGFIECHHTVPLGTGGERVTTTSELAALCSNCHRMIHQSDPMLTVEQLRERVRA